MVPDRPPGQLRRCPGLPGDPPVAGRGRVVNRPLFPGTAGTPPRAAATAAGSRLCVRGEIRSRIAGAYPWPGGASYRYMGTRDRYLAAGFHDITVPSGYAPSCGAHCTLPGSAPQPGSPPAHSRDEHRPATGHQA